MFKEFISYIKSPQEGMPYSFGPKSLLKSLWFYLWAVFFVTLGVAIGCTLLGKAFPELMRPMVVGRADAPAWIVAFLGPIIEESSFRLALNRKKVYLAIALSTLTFMLVSSFCFSHSIYTTDHLPVRIGIAVVVGLALTFLLGKFLTTCKFKPYFWFWALLFGSLHLMNANYSGMLPLDFISLILYTATRILMGLVLGFIRMKNSFATSTALHILNNLITVL